MKLFRATTQLAIAGPEMAAELAGFYDAAWSSGDGRAIPEPAPDAVDVEAWLEGGLEVLVARHEGQLSGAVRCGFPSGHCLMDRFAVLPQRRRRGVGRALAEGVFQRGRRAGLQRVWSSVPGSMDGAVAFHHALGFRECGSVQADYWGEKAILMELLL